MELRGTTDNLATNRDDDDGADFAPRPRTMTVLSLLAVAAATFSYLGAFAVTNALANADIIPPIPRDPDPRLRWAAIGFVSLMLSFGVIAFFLRQMSRRQFRSWWRRLAKGLRRCFDFWNGPESS